MTAPLKPNPYRGVRPCAKCPFRADVVPYIRGARASQIARSLLEGGGFTCHETTVHDDPDGDGGDLVAGPKEMECAGALITLEKGEGANQMMRIAERIGLYDAERLAMDSPTYDSLAEWTAAVHRAEGAGVLADEDGEVIELEHCGVVGDDCEDPAGFAFGGGAASNPDPPTVDPRRSCQFCGNAPCGACTASEMGGLVTCTMCAADDEDSDGE